MGLRGSHESARSIPAGFCGVYVGVAGISGDFDGAKYENIMHTLLEVFNFYK